MLRDDLAERALDLARMVRLIAPGHTEAAGLLALLLIHHARRGGRTDANGGLVLLADQDRSRWDRASIAEADRLITAALTRAPVIRAAPGRFTVQAAIAALHARARTYAETDWPQIRALYDRLLVLWPSPVVALNRAVAVAMVDGPAPALALVEDLERDGRLAGYPYLPSTRADLLARLGRPRDAVEAYRVAVELTGNAAEKEFLTGRIAALST